MPIVLGFLQVANVSVLYQSSEGNDRKVSSNNMLERLNKEIRRRTRVVGIFPDPESYLRLVTAHLMEYSEDWSVSRSYLSEESLVPLNNQAA